MNWSKINSEKKLKGFICYKAGMSSAYVMDNTPNSLTKGKKIIIPVTILACPPLKILSVRFYKNKKVIKEFLAQNLDKELKRKIKIPKQKEKEIGEVKEYDDIKIIAYSQAKKTGIKKTPDLVEIGLNGTKEEKLNFVKENIKKELSALDFFEKGELIDLRGLTKGKGLVGPVKRFGITLKSHKSEKGRRRPGSLGPWHPARVTFRVPMAGQLGMFTRVAYNNQIIKINNGEDKLKNIKNFGDIKTQYILVKGSVQGAAKRPLIITKALRPTKKQLKKNYEFIQLRGGNS